MQPRPTNRVAYLIYDGKSEEVVKNILSLLLTVQAYKKLAMQWHPDKFQAEEDKKAAEKKFMDIAAAKEVLMDAGIIF